MKSAQCPAGVPCKEKPQHLNSDWTHCYRTECASGEFEEASIKTSGKYAGRVEAIAAECKSLGGEYKDAGWHDCGDFHFSGKCTFLTEEDEIAQETKEDEAAQETDVSETPPAVNKKSQTEDDKKNENLPKDKTYTIIVAAIVVVLLFLWMNQSQK